MTDTKQWFRISIWYTSCRVLRLVTPWLTVTAAISPFSSHCILRLSKSTLQTSSSNEMCLSTYWIDRFSLLPLTDISLCNSQHLTCNKIYILIIKWWTLFVVQCAHPSYAACQCIFSTQVPAPWLPNDFQESSWAYISHTCSSYQLQ